MKTKYIVVTTCTNRKSLKGGKPIRFPRGTAPSLHKLAANWRNALNMATFKVAVRDLYVGRSFSESIKTATALSADLFVISAGLGLIKDHALVPSYNLTIADKSFLTKLAKLGATPSDWWRSLHSDNHGLSSLLANEKRATILLAIPASYVPLITDDLSRIPNTNLKRLRIFTSEAGRNALPPELVECALPYDERIEGSTYSGTRTDFAARTMWHYVSELQAQDLSLDLAKQKVAASMAKLKKPVIPTRRKIDDAEVTLLIKGNWNKFSGNSSRLLRYLRDEALVACEQSRFRALHHAVKSQMI